MADDATRLVVAVEANTKQIENALKRLGVVTDQTSRRMSSSMNRLDASFANMGKTVTSLGRTFGAAFGVSLGIGTISQLPGIFAAAAKRAGDLADAASKIGIGTKSLQELQYAAGQSGVEIGELEEALTRFSRNLGDANSKGNDLSRILKANGVAIRDASGNLRSFDDLLGDVANLIQNAANEQDALVIATAAFGRAGAGMVNILKSGKGGLVAFRAEAQKLGLVMGDDLVQAGAKVDDELQKLESRFGKFADTALLKTLQVVEAIGKIEHAAADALQGAFGQSAEDKAKAAGAAAGKMIAGRPITNRIDNAFKDVGGLITAVDPGDLKKISDAAEEAAHPVTKLGEAAEEAADKLRSSAFEAIGKQITASGTDAASLLRRLENPNGPWMTPHFDTNRLRIGYSSDTQTDPMGRVRPVTAGSTSTVADAERDLARRISLIQMELIKVIGEDVFKQLNSGAIAAITSIGYNYGTGGSAFKGVANAARGGNAVDVSNAILGLPQNPGRRRIEAETALTGAPEGDVALKNLQAQNAAMDEAKEKTAELVQAKQQLIESAQQEIEALGLEAKSFGESTYQAEKEKEAFNLLNQAKQAGIPITDDLIAKINELASAHAAGVVAVDQAKTAQDQFSQSQEDLTARADEFRSFSSGILSGFVSDLAHGKDAADALSDALGKIADKLIDIASNALINGLFGQQGSPLGGIFGGLFGGGGGSALSAATSAGVSTAVGLLHSGGYAGSGGATRMVSPSLFTGAPHYHSGGIAGLKPGEVPAILQQGEYVVPRGMSPVNLRMPKMGGSRASGQQRVGIDSRVRVDASPLLIATMDSKVDEGNRRVLAAVPGYLRDNQRRQPGQFGA